jgi:hypothetical protein
LSSTPTTLSLSSSYVQCMISAFIMHM